MMAPGKTALSSKFGAEVREPGFGQKIPKASTCQGQKAAERLR